MFDRQRGAARDVGMSAHEFFLSRDLPTFSIENDQNAIEGTRWISVSQNRGMYLAFVIIANETILTPTIEIQHDAILKCDMTQGVSRISADGLDAELFFRSDGQSTTLMRIPLKPGQTNDISVTFDLAALEARKGQLGITCHPGPLNDPTGDWLAITRWVIGRSDHITLLQARANPEWRIKNEVGHFTSAYDHEMYAGRASGLSIGLETIEILDVKNAPAANPIDPPRVRGEDLVDKPAATVRENDDVFHYGMRVLTDLIPTPSDVDYAGRLKDLAQNVAPIRFLSLLSGAAGIERGIFESAHVPIEVTLFDLNENLLRRGAANLSDIAEVRCVMGDVNNISATAFGDKFHIVACVSGLHHVVELERVMKTVNDVLVPEGEFWLIGEQVGRDGNRLWPEAAEIANRLFSALPADLRRNAYTGEVDMRLPDKDASASCFEGIRSSEIEQLLLTYFEPVHLYRRNCFLWRLLDQAYFSNYNLKNETHRRTVLHFVAEEFNHWKNGGRPTECFNVYRLR